MIRIPMTACVLLMMGCAAAPTRLSAVPDADTLRARIPGMQGIRYFLPENAKEFEAEALAIGAAELR
jgi:hypothetical protein